MARSRAEVDPWQTDPDHPDYLKASTLVPHAMYFRAAGYQPLPLAAVEEIVDTAIRDATKDGGSPENYAAQRQNVVDFLIFTQTEIAGSI